MNAAVGFTPRELPRRGACVHLKHASADHARLLKLDRGLAAQLEAVIVRRVTGDDRAGISPQYD